MKLLAIVESDNPKKKYKARFLNDNGRTKTVHFGAEGMDDYTLKGDKEQRARYRARHAKDLKGDPTKPGYLSYYVLWGDSTNINTNIDSYKKRFGF
jgi:hypothetical protein